MRGIAPVGTLWRLCLLAAAGALGGCAATGTDGAAPAVEQTSNGSVYQCSDQRFVARFENGSVLLSLPEGTVRLPRQIAASGTKYGNDDITFWGKDDTATLTGPNRATAHCRRYAAAAAWEDARLRGIDFRAVGDMPTWTLEIDRGDSVYLMIEGNAAPIILARPVPSFDPESTQTFYRARSKTHGLLVTVYGDRCDREMDGERMLHRVMVRLNGQELKGCGRTIH